MHKLFHIHKYPIWLFALGTQAKSFRDNPILGSRTLNRLGLHAGRVLLADISARIRWMMLSPLMPKDLRLKYRRDGFVLIENFLSLPDVQKIRDEIKTYSGPVRQMSQGDTATQRIMLDTAASTHLPVTSEAAHSKKLRNYLAYCGAKWSHSVMYVQRIHNGFRKAAADPQKNIHSDTFHPTMKAWLFLEDVPEAKGPFTYVPGSARLTWARLKWEYRRSVNAASLNDKYSEKGSMRAEPKDFAELNLEGPKGITVKAGTLVIANTHGFHGRGQAEPGASRIELWAYSRNNPFSIWPGLPLDFVANVKYRAMEWFRRRKDKQAAAKGGRASWFLIDAAGMVRPDKQAEQGHRLPGVATGEDPAKKNAAK
ncbi:MAG: phytanoyl-CoA dioxygenase [Kordiimonadales bacterium]|nr:MAG: phytanoyl-CoA dioxygenase [Kordiimonadales bacterium]